ncbi:hypothetical protein MNBD_IGNAVI01-2269, partial [hydrothermal vent metagenome]
MLKKIIILVLILFLAACKAPDDQSEKRSVRVTLKGPVTEIV